MVFSMFIFSFVGLLVSIPFYTMIERKILSYIQNRKGPKKVSFLGILQPVADGLKLLIKGWVKLLKSNNFLYNFSPLLIFVMMVLNWFFLPSYFPLISLKYCLLMVVCINALSVYSVLGSGWGSKSKYSLLGSIRGASQTVSYEVSLFILVMLPAFLVKNFKFLNFNNTFFMIMLVVWCWGITILAETNRAPFDFAEGESELVSGFKVEYSALGFVFLFLGEYGLMIFFSFLSGFVFLGLGGYFLVMVGFIMSTLFLVVRGVFPRFRYDLLMSVVWKFILPWVMIVFLVVFVV